MGENNWYGTNDKKPCTEEEAKAKSEEIAEELRKQGYISAGLPVLEPLHPPMMKIDEFFINSQ